MPEKLADLIEKLMAKDRDERPDSAAKVRDRLRKWAAPPAPPDAPGELQRILKTITSNPDADGDSAPALKVVEMRNWPLYLIVSGIGLLAVALVVMIVMLLKK